MSNEPHRKRIRHIEGLGHLHELTFSCYRRKPLLTNDPWRRILARSIDQTCNDEEFGLVAFVFMPEHVHLLVVPFDKEQSRVSRFLARVKQPTSRQIKVILVDNNSSLVEQLRACTTISYRIPNPGKSSSPYKTRVLQYLLSVQESGNLLVGGA
jgi:REP element-mobilizing transposase RayT